MEEAILLILILLTILSTYCLYRMFEKRGLYFSIILMNIISLVLAFKITTVFKININLSIICLIGSFSALYFLLTEYGHKDNKTILKISLYSNIAIGLLLATMNYFVPAITETISINMEGAFEYNYKILIIYPFAMLLSQYTIMKLYKLLTEIQKNASICIILTYIITGLIYTVLLSVLMYINVLEMSSSIFIGISTYIIGLPITLINIIFINIMTSKKVKF